MKGKQPKLIHYIALSHSSSHPSYTERPVITFLNRAAPVPERMASIKACLASAGLLKGPLKGPEGGWGAGGREGGGGGGM